MAAPLWISVDIESTGPAPGVFSMISLGAWVVGKDRQQEGTTFYAELEPISEKYQEAALKVAAPGKTHAQLYTDGEDPQMVMIRFVDWVKDQARRYGGSPTFVAHNAPFDWMFVTWYLWRYVEENPFGWAAVDTRALFFGMSDAGWSKTRLEQIKQRFPLDRMHKHHALEDAIEQGELFLKLLEARRPLPG
ncbi:MAG: 3'-5' exonuclease [Deltaproteobacteria bacterium]|nr:3'-5' exonuclease [Deltaproteobacteria bacterium]